MQTKQKTNDGCSRKASAKQNETIIAGEESGIDFTILGRTDDPDLYAEGGAGWQAMLVDNASNLYQRDYPQLSWTACRALRLPDGHVYIVLRSVSGCVLAVYRHDDGEAAERLTSYPAELVKIITELAA